MERAAEGGNPRALTALGEIYLYGGAWGSLGIEKDIEHAEEYITSAIRARSGERAWLLWAELLIDNARAGGPDGAETLEMGIQVLSVCGETHSGCVDALIEIYDTGLLSIQPDCEQAAQWVDRFNELSRANGGSRRGQFRISEVRSRDHLVSCQAD